MVFSLPKACLFGFFSELGKAVSSVTISGYANTN